MPPTTTVPDPVVFPPWDPAQDHGVPGRERHGEAVLAYSATFGRVVGAEKYAASKPATIVSFESYQKTDIHSSPASNCIFVKFDQSVGNDVLVNARDVWPSKSSVSAARGSGGVGGSSGGAAAKPQDLAGLQSECKSAQAHILELATENKTLGESAKLLFKMNSDIEKQLKSEKKITMQMVQQLTTLETAASEAQQRQQDAQDELLRTQKKLDSAEEETQSARNELLRVQTELDTQRAKNISKKSRGPARASAEGGGGH